MIRALRYSPTRRLAALLALAAPVWLLSDWPAGRAAAWGVLGLVLLAAVADALTIPGAASLSVERELPRAVGLGESAAGRYRIASRWPLPLDVEVHDALAPGVERVESGLERIAPGGAEPADADAAAPHARAANTATPWLVGRVRLPPGERAGLELRVAGRLRGEHRAGDVVLRVHGALGLMRRSLVYSPGGVVAVVPALSDLRAYRLLALQHRLRDAGVRAIRRRGEGLGFTNLREYVEGDDPRRVDWKATARRGKLITREYSVEQGQTVIIAVDAGRMMTQLSGTVSRFEHALASADVLADVASRSGDHVGLIVFDDEVRAFVAPAKGALALRRVREAMLPLRASMAEPDYAGAFRTLAERHRKRSLIVLYSDVVDPRASRALIAHTARSAARHLPLVVALRNDELVAAALPRGEDGESVYESAAAEELLLGREEALTAMRRAGVSVLDVSPRLMTAAVVNRYLAIKARAAL